MFWLIDTVIVRPIINILFVIYNFVGDFGLAIILFTVIVKICMWPLVKRQLHQTRLMRKIQPELAEIKKRCKGNRQMESLQMMDLYKRNNIKPMSSVLTLFIQLPIFIALFGGISAIANPRASGNTCGYTNVDNCAYAPVRNLERIKNVINLQESYLADPEEGYDFHPQLFGIVNLDTRASNVLNGDLSASTILVLLFALSASGVQYYMTRQQMPSKNKGNSLKQMMKSAADGKEPSQEDLNAMASRQMSYMMPVMMFIIMFSLPGALVFYYLLSNIITVAQQKIVLSKDVEEMEESADKAILKELRNIKEAEIIENKKSGTKITRISAKSNKKRRK